MFENLIFDWSGTLVDDLAPVVEATNAVLSRYGVRTLDREGFRRHFRLPYREFYAEMLPDVPLETLEGHFRAAFSASTAPVTVLPHAREKLEWCKRVGVRSFVLSSMDAAAFGEQLERFGFSGYFEATYAGVLDKRDLIHGILERHGLAAAQTAFVGDMTHDIDTAHHGGISSVAVLTGYQDSEILASARPDLTVPDLEALRNLMARSRFPRPSANGAGAAPETIEIRGLELPVHIGVPDEERAHPQTLRAHIRMEIDARFEQLDDDLSHTVDYEAAANEIVRLAAARPRKLIETLAADIARHLLDSHPPVRRVEVEIEKKILPGTDCVAVKITRAR